MRGRVKRYIEAAGHGQLLVGKDRMQKTVSLVYILSSVLKIKKDVIDIYKDICRRANRVLHVSDSAISEKEALAAVEQLRKFILKFPAR